jgi:hypothetical protein
LGASDGNCGKDTLTPPLSQREREERLMKSLREYKKFTNSSTRNDFIVIHLPAVYKDNNFPQTPDTLHRSGPLP